MEFDLLLRNSHKTLAQRLPFHDVECLHRMLQLCCRTLTSAAMSSCHVAEPQYHHLCSDHYGYPARVRAHQIPTRLQEPQGSASGSADKSGRRLVLGQGQSRVYCPIQAHALAAALRWRLSPGLKCSAASFPLCSSTAFLCSCLLPAQPSSGHRYNRLRFC